MRHSDKDHRRLLVSNKYSIALAIIYFSLATSRKPTPFLSRHQGNVHVHIHCHHAAAAARGTWSVMKGLIYGYITH